MQVEFLPEVLSAAKSVSAESHLLASHIPISSFQHPQLIFSQCPIPSDTASYPDMNEHEQQNIIITSFHPSQIITPLACNIDDHTYSCKTDMKEKSPTKADLGVLPRQQQCHKSGNKEDQLINNRIDQQGVVQSAGSLHHV